MYSLVRAYARLTAGAGRLELVDNNSLLQLKFNQISTTYPYLVMILSHNTEPEKELRFDFTLDAGPFYDTFLQTNTVAQWLVWLGNRRLPTHDGGRRTTLRAYTAEAVRAGFHIEPVKQSGVPSATLPLSATRDLFITHPTLGGETIFNNVVVSVNGFLHRTYYGERGLYVMEGGRTMVKANKNIASIHSFANLGGVEIIPISEAMIEGLPEEGERMRSPLYLKTPDFDWTDKTPFMSLGGYLLPLGRAFRLVGKHLFQLNLMQYPLLAHFFESEKVIDLSSVRGVVTSRANNDQVLSVDDVFSAAFIKAYLTLSQTFIVAVNSRDVYFDYHQMETTQHPGVFLTGQVPDGMALTETNQIIDYIVGKERDRYSVTATTSLRDNLLIDKAPWLLNNAVDPRNVGYQPKSPIRARMLSIGRDIFTV